MLVNTREIYNSLQNRWHSNFCEALVFKTLENAVFIRNTAIFVRESSLSYFPVNYRKIAWNFG